MVSGRASHPDGVLYLGPRDVDGDQLCGCHRSGSSSSGRLRRQALQDIRQIAVWVVSVELGRLDPAHDDGHSLAGTQRANASKAFFTPSRPSEPTLFRVAQPSTSMLPGALSHAAAAPDGLLGLLCAQDP